LQNKRRSGRPERTGRLFQKFHKESKMRFAKNIWPGLLALATVNAGILKRVQQASMKGD
jgi:hypothetical protein